MTEQGTSFSAPLARSQAGDGPPATSHEPQLSPGRKYWWTGTEWVPAADSTDAQRALSALLAVPRIEPLAPTTGTVLKRAVLPPPPKAVEQVEEVVEDEPMPEHWADLSTPVAETVAPADVEPVPAPPVTEVAAAAVSRLVPRSWPVRLGVAALMVLLLVGGAILRHRQQVADHRAAVTKTLTDRLLQTALFEDRAHVFESRYGGKTMLLHYGWTDPTDVVLTVPAFNRFVYCVQASLGGRTMSVRNGAAPVERPC